MQVNGQLLVIELFIMTRKPFIMNSSFATRWKWDHSIARERQTRD